MKIIVTGAGSGGHITPILAVAKAIKHKQPDSEIIYIGQKGDRFADIPANDSNIDEVCQVRAGKFRRYHGEGFKQLLDLKTWYLNIRDFVYVSIGLWQSWRLLKELSPDIIFIKGGYVGVPIGLAAATRHIPYITHDSDAIPGLANRIIARWAKIHAVALPAEVYKYPADRTVTTGIPLRDGFEPVSSALKQKYRAELNLPKKGRVLFVIGGGLGSQIINQAVGEAIPHLLNEFRDLHVIHAVGKLNYAEILAKYKEGLSDSELSRLDVHDFIDDVYKYSGAADLVITRAGATNLAEFALQGKACIVIPSAFLAGGHQLQNARYLEEQNAAAILDEEYLKADPNRLARLASELLRDDKRRHNMEQSISQFAKPKATQTLADLILNQAGK